MSGSVKGWCPSSYRPMMSGDGLLVRVKPGLGQLRRDEALALADLAERHGNGMIDLTSRANLQLRGVPEAEYPALLGALVDLGLVDRDERIEARLSIVTAPFWQSGDLTERLARALRARLGDFPDLPDKMGFVIDTGPLRMLGDVSGDIRFETASNSALIVRAEGSEEGRVVGESSAIDAAIELAEWFVATGGTEHRRMRRHLAQVPLPRELQGAFPAWTTDPSVPGGTFGGRVVGVPFGAMLATELRDLIVATGAGHLRVTPWRLLFLEEAAETDHPAFIHAPDDPLLGTSACPGSPLCASAEVSTREVARKLARIARGTLHVSGCTKGCARQKAADVTLVGRAGRFDLVRNGCASDTPERRGLGEAELMELFA